MYTWGEQPNLNRMDHTATGTPRTSRSFPLIAYITHTSYHAETASGSGTCTDSLFMGHSLPCILEGLLSLSEEWPVLLLGLAQADHNHPTPHLREYSCTENVHTVTHSWKH